MPKRTDPRDAEIGKRLRIARMTAGMSQTDLANAVGVTFQQIQKYEKGANRVAVSRLMQIAKALKCDPSDFMGTPGTKTQNAGSEILDQMIEPGALRMVQAFNGMAPKVRNAITTLIIELARLT
jgi:transcriptional regulator with XRE-family HTH domain